jgi:hypothetical protein
MAPNSESARGSGARGAAVAITGSELLTDGDAREYAAMALRRSKRSPVSGATRKIRMIPLTRE